VVTFDSGTNRQTIHHELLVQVSPSQIAVGMMQRNGPGLWLSARAAATVLALGGPIIMSPS